MKELTLYPPEELYVRYLFKSVQNYGVINCDLETFTKLYNEWCEKNLSGNSGKVLQMFETLMLENFIEYLASTDI